MATKVRVDFDGSTGSEGLRQLAEEASRTGGHFDSMSVDVRDSERILKEFGEEAAQVAQTMLRMSTNAGEAQKSWEAWQATQNKAASGGQAVAKKAIEGGEAVGSMLGRILPGFEGLGAILATTFPTLIAWLAGLIKWVPVVGSLVSLFESFRTIIKDWNTKVIDAAKSTDMLGSRLADLGVLNKKDMEDSERQLKASNDARVLGVELSAEDKAYLQSQSEIIKFNADLRRKEAAEREKDAAKRLRSEQEINAAIKQEIEATRELAQAGKLSDQQQEQSAIKLDALRARNEEVRQKTEESRKKVLELESSMTGDVQKKRFDAENKNLDTIEQVRAEQEALLANAKALAATHEYDEAQQRAHATAMASLNERASKIEQDAEDRRKKAADEEQKDARTRHQQLVEYIEAGKKAKIFDEKRLKELTAQERELAKLRTDAVELENDAEARRHKQKMDDLEKEKERQEKGMEAFRTAAKLRFGADLFGQSGQSQQQSPFASLGQQPSGGDGGGYGGGYPGGSSGSGAAGGSSGGGSDVVTGNRNKRNPFRNQLLTPSMPLISMQIPQGLGIDVDLTQFMGLGGDATAGMPDGGAQFGPDGRRLTTAERRRINESRREQQRRDRAGGFRNIETGMSAEAQRQRQAQLVRDAGGDVEAQLLAYRTDPNAVQRNIEESRAKQSRAAAKAAFPGGDRLSRQRRRRMETRDRQRTRRDIQRGATSPQEQAEALGKEMKNTVDGMKDFEGSTRESTTKLKDFADELGKTVDRFLQAQQRLDALMGMGMPVQRQGNGGGRPFNRAAAQAAGRGG